MGKIPSVIKIVAHTGLQAEWIALTNNAILLTRNQSNFGQIVELQIEDWVTVSGDE